MSRRLRGAAIVVGWFGGSAGRWVLETVHLAAAWEVVVEPDELDRVIVVITAYKVTTW